METKATARAIEVLVALVKEVEKMNKNLNNLCETIKGAGNGR